MNYFLHNYSIRKMQRLPSCRWGNWEWLKLTMCSRSHSWLDKDPDSLPDWGDLAVSCVWLRNNCQNIKITGFVDQQIRFQACVRSWANYVSFRSPNISFTTRPRTLLRGKAPGGLVFAVKKTLLCSVEKGDTSSLRRKWVDNEKELFAVKTQ